MTAKPRILISGGAGFIGCNVAIACRRQWPNSDVVVLDNLHRNGAAGNIIRLVEVGATFVHGDVRSPSDLAALSGNFDVLIHAAAEPSVHAGADADARRYLFDTNVGGTINELEFVRERCGGLIFLSTSRVFSINELRKLPLCETETRFQLADSLSQAGVSDHGIAEDFATVGRGSRSLYGSSKLAAELFVEEYAEHYGVHAIINRCGVVAGPGQFGRSDQGVFALWPAYHMLGRELQYTGFGGMGKQVRDVLHPNDLAALIMKQIDTLADHAGTVYSVGGGLANSVSLCEYSALCRDVTGQSVAIQSVPDTAAVDVPYFVTDARRVQKAFGWQPTRSARDIVRDLHHWLSADNGTALELFR